MCIEKLSQMEIDYFVLALELIIYIMLVDDVNILMIHYCDDPWKRAIYKWIYVKNKLFLKMIKRRLYVQEKTHGNKLARLYLLAA